MPIKLANNATSTIATAINASDVGVVLATGDGAKFPTLAAGEYFYITFESTGGTYEIAKATARAGDSLTIVRAQEGTTAQSFAAGSRVELRVTVQGVEDLIDDYDDALRADLAASGGAALIGNTPAGTIAATTVQGALNEIVSDLAASSGTSLVGHIQSGSGATARTVQAKLRETVSVKDFGAVGDGVADDTTAFINAIAASDSVYVPEGIYLVDYVWIGKNGFTLRGAGVDSTVIKARSIVNRFFKIQYALNDASDPAATINYTSIGGFTIDGDGKADIGLYTSASECQELISNVKIIDTLVTGHQHWRGFTNNVYGLQITQNAGDGLRMDNEANNTNWAIEVNNNDGIGVQIYSGSTISISGGVEGNGLQGFIIKSVPNTSGGIYVPTNVTLLKLDNVYVEGNCTTNSALGNIEIGAGTGVTQNILLHNTTINVFDSAIGLFIKSNIQYLSLDNVNIGAGTNMIHWDSSYTTYYDLVYASQRFKNVYVNGGMVVVGNTGLNQSAANLVCGGGSSSYPFITQAKGPTIDLVGSGGSGIVADGTINFWRQNQLTGTIKSVPNVGLDISNPLATFGYVSLSNAVGEVARITPTSQLLVGDTSAVASGKQEIAFVGSTNNGLIINNTNGSGLPFHIGFRFSNTDVGNISCTASTTSYVTSSDYRLKEAVAPMTDALNTVAKLKPVTYKWKIDGSNGQGFIAHELQEVCPAAVTGVKDAVDKEGNPKYQGIDTSFLVATLVAAIQELKDEIDKLKAGA